ncbi:RHS repeat-associated core domain-containing protein [Streptomyces sp. NPDC047000]|uniref:RHS repeat-associated core domain-containing protein n=1 Tax=Streptomyces sp. NPDC047000 TaxID=3155474 RepID=UPI00341170B8
MVDESDTLTFLMVGKQASTQLAVDATTRRRYTPSGDERSGTLPAGTSNGFLGKTEDTSTGLSLLGARAYDPYFGRFLSNDPLLTPYDPQDLSGYSYSRNNPIAYSDPSGLSFTSEDHSDGSNLRGLPALDRCLSDVQRWSVVVRVRPRLSAGVVTQSDTQRCGLCRVPGFRWTPAAQRVP